LVAMCEGSFGSKSPIILTLSSWSIPCPPDIIYVKTPLRENLPNRDREEPRGLPPPTPPDIRVTSPAVRQIPSGGYVPPNRSICSRGASREVIPDAGPSAQHLAGCELAAPPQATTPLCRSGLQHVPRAYDAVCGLLRCGQGGVLRPQSSTRTQHRSPGVSLGTFDA
jgi:hypothetical protein